MKNTLFLFALLLGLAACTSAVAIPTRTAAPATATPVPSPTDTPTPTKTLPPTASPTPAPSLTPDLSQFFTMPNTLQEFQVGQKVYIPDILSQLQSGLSHLTPGSEAPPNGGIANNYGNLEININCNYHGKVNCAPVAFMQFQDQGLDIHVIFYEIRNRDGSSGWLVVYDFDSQQRNGPYAYPRLVANPTGPFDLTIDTRANATFQKIKPYAVSLMTLDFINAINTLITSGNVPDPLNDGSMIVAGAP